MAQREQVDRRAHADGPGQGGEGGRLDEAVEPLPALERDVITDAELVDAGGLGSLDDCSQLGRAGLEQLPGRAQPDPHHHDILLLTNQSIHLT